MGIYIKNEEMPESCYECAYSVEKDGICSITEGGCDWGHSRPPHCPLQEIDLVRCGECKYAKYRIENIEYEKCMITQLFVNKNDFCSYGEPRESEYVAKD